MAATGSPCLCQAIQNTVHNILRCLKRHCTLTTVLYKVRICEETENLLSSLDYVDYKTKKINSIFWVPSGVTNHHNTQQISGGVIKNKIQMKKAQRKIRKKKTKLIDPTNLDQNYEHIFFLGRIKKHVYINECSIMEVLTEKLFIPVLVQYS